MANVVLFFLKKSAHIKYMYVTLMDSLEKNAVLTSTPLSLQTANKNNVLNKMVNQMPIYVQVLNASNAISRDNGIRKK